MSRSDGGGAPRGDDGAGLLEDLESDSEVLAIVFGGLLMRVGMMPPFEFFNVIAQSAPAKKIFVRDHRQAWYHGGVRGLAADIDGVAEGLRRRIDAVQPTRVVTLGTSAGGYAALLFGRLLGVSEAHAFSPQTFISPDLRERYGDGRWPHAWSKLMSSGAYQPAYGDLAQTFGEAGPSAARLAPAGTRFVVHYGAGDDLGTVHAERLASRSSDVRLIRYDIDDKAVVRHLRDTGGLTELLRGILAA
jgi:acetyl esterase/lipase